MADTLVAKLARIMAEIKHVAKAGENKFHGYKFATEADIADAVRGGLSAAGIMMIPSHEELTWREVVGKNSTQAVGILKVKFTVTDGNESIVFYTYGEGQDSGDKCLYKAATGATKYALLKLFLIPTGDDPEKDEPKPKDEPKAKAKTETKPDPNVKYISSTQAKELWAAAKAKWSDADDCAKFFGDILLRVCNTTRTAETPLEKYAAVMKEITGEVAA